MNDQNELAVYRVTDLLNQALIIQQAFKRLIGFFKKQTEYFWSKTKNFEVLQGRSKIRCWK